jgi:hypothetical protein
MNQTDDGYIVDLIRPDVEAAPKRILRIEWLDDPPVISSPVSAAVERSIANYRDLFPKHLKNHAIPFKALRSFQTVLSYGPRGLTARAEAVDDRGKLHKKCVLF